MPRETRLRFSYVPPFGGAPQALANVVFLKYTILVKLLHKDGWYIELLTLAGIVSIILGTIGSYWDIAWHLDFGRDRFWSPPHLFIYGSIALTTIFLLLNLSVAIANDFPHKRKSLFHLILFGLGSALIVYLSAPLDELWHRLYGVDIQILSLPHVMLIFGGIVGSVAILSILRYHILHERRRFLVERILLPVFLGSILIGIMLLLGENEFTTLPPTHPAYGRDPRLYWLLAIVSGASVFLAARRVSGLRYAATLTFVAYTAVRLVPMAYNAAVGMKSIPIVPPFLPFLLLLALGVDAVFGVVQRRRAAP